MDSQQTSQMIRSRRARMVLGLLALTLLSMFSVDQSLAQGQVVETDSHRFEEVKDGVWHVSGTGTVYTMSNAMVIVGEFDALVVDSHVTPTAAKALLDSLPAITDKPVRYLINSHYHFDHAHGNLAFPREVEIIGHEFTRAKLNGDIGNVLEERTFNSFTSPVPATIANLERQAAAATDPQQRAQLEQRLQVQRDYLQAIDGVVPTPPNITLEEKMTLFQAVAEGSREVQVLHLGRAHTAGDVVVYLPQSAVVFTGDMMLPGISYMGDAHVDEWPQTLEALKALDFDTWIPGHGPIMRSRTPMDNFQAYLRDLWRKAEGLHRQGLNWQQAAGQIDMTNHIDNYRQLSRPGVDPRAVRRIFELLDQR